MLVDAFCPTPMMDNRYSPKASLIGYAKLSSKH
jgi:hypothetical protein